jgi:predicted RNase H-like nuclease (RuvC/YqgF family)
MSDDLVKRLRSPEVFLMTSGMISPVAYEAADRIEKLEASEAEWQPICDSYAAENQRFSDRIERLEAEVDRLVKSRNKWGKLYNQTLEKLRLSVMSDSEYVKIIDEKCAEQADRIKKLEAALRKIKDLHHDGGIEDLQERDDMTYKIVCDTLGGKDG